MTKHIYFGQVPAIYLDQVEYFEFEGRYFYYRITLTEEQEVHIEDSVGRYVPIDPESLEAFALAMNVAMVQMDDQAIVEIV